MLHTDLAQKYSIRLQEIFMSKLCSHKENYFLGVEGTCRKKEVKGYGAYYGRYQTSGE
jgi:hypothetical protein